MALAENVRMFPGISPNDYDARIILEMCARRDIKDVIVIGWEADGDFLFTSSIADGPERLWLLELAKTKLLAGPEES